MKRTDHPEPAGDDLSAEIIIVKALLKYVRALALTSDPRKRIAASRWEMLLTSKLDSLREDAAAGLTETQEALLLFSQMQRRIAGATAGMNSPAARTACAEVEHTLQSEIEDLRKEDR